MYGSDCGALSPENATYCFQCGHMMPGSFATPPPKPDNYLVWGILSTLFCCMPFGVVSIVYGAQVDSRYGARDNAGAKEASLTARKRSQESAITWLAGAGLNLLFWLVMALGLHLFDHHAPR